MLGSGLDGTLGVGSEDGGVEGWVGSGVGDGSSSGVVGVGSGGLVVGSGQGTAHAPSVSP